MATQPDRVWLSTASAVITERMNLATSLSIFESFFGIEPLICQIIWDLIAPSIRVLELRNFKRVHLLWGLHFLKVYSSEKVMAATFKTTPKTFRRYAKLAVELVCWQMPHVVS